MPNLYFYRDSNGNEADIIFQNGRELVAIEVKSSSTYQSTLLKGLKKVVSLSPSIVKAYLVYAGSYKAFSDGLIALKYNQVEDIFTVE